MSDRATARIRTALPQFWAALIIWAIDRYAGVIPADAGEYAVIIWPAIGATIYDLARDLEATRSPFARRIAGLLLGSLRSPQYPPPGLPLPPPPAPPAP